MNSRAIGRYFILIILAAVFLGFNGCATTGHRYQEEEPVQNVADIDQLLGLTEPSGSGSGRAGQDDNTIDEDDVLKLLGVPEESGAYESGSGMGETDKLRHELMELENRESSLNRQEQNLESTLNRQEQIMASIDQDQTPVRPADQAGSYSSRYQQAYQKYLSRNYREAIRMFEALLAESSRHSLSDNCQYWIGECYYAMANYQQAILAFQKVFTFAQSNKNADAQLKLGLCYWQLQDQGKAKLEFQKLVDNYPTSDYVSIAQRYLEQ